jgi:glutaredoxin-related protein
MCSVKVQQLSLFDNSRSEKTLRFIEKAMVVHGGRYLYDKVEYVNAHAKVSIVCGVHGVFFASPNNHLRGKGCAKCAGRYTPSTQEFILESIKIHSDKYDYSNTIYAGSGNNVRIRCKLHNFVFEQRAICHKRGHGCPKCAGEKKRISKVFNVSQFVEASEKKHGKRYDYSEVIYINAREKVKIRCKIHDFVFEQMPYHHIKDNGCPKCSNKYKPNTQEVIENFKEIHKNQYDYSEVSYAGANSKVKIKCVKHNLIFEQTAYHHKNGSGCLKCGLEKTAKYTRENPTGWNYKYWIASAKKSKRFTSFKVYILKCWNDEEVFFKIGKTYREINKRFDYFKTMPYNYEVVKIFESEDGRYICELERELQNKNKEYAYTPKIEFDGMYECFSKII